ncbi:SWIM zinc finger family protein [Herbidospora yilanensis]|uniref:SWIM zinc finger family protein n=1 Tax=Herbidospora yilanensis TaxID=354426 RepID=UPI0007824377|nr:SWIM zinc finger family protein [Herbidospora yilanensis]
MIERWSRDQVLALAPDAASQKAASGVSAPRKWSAMGVSGSALWGECAGSGSKPYQACVDLSEPAYRCSCPSRKFPCKHALGLLLLWSADGVPPAAELAPWAAEWFAQRAARAEKAAEKKTAEKAEPSAAKPDEGRARQREERVTAGLAELERWLSDQVASGLSDARQTGLAEWSDLAKRLVDAQAPGLAGTFSGLTRVFRDENWPGRLLGEYAMVHLLAVAHRRAAELPGDLRETVRQRVGYQVAKETVLALPPIRDEWQVIALRDEERDRLLSRRVWLHGRATGRVALVLSFAPPGQPLDASLVPGTRVDADVSYYPGAAPLRALIADRYGPAVPARAPASGVTVEGVPQVIADVLTRDPWTESWPLVLTGARVGRDGKEWCLLGDSGRGLRLHPSAGDPWKLVAVSGGHPVTVAVEWTPDGLRPLTTWDENDEVVVL